MSRYRAPTAEATAALRDRGSRFFAHVAPAGTAAEAKAFVTEVERRHPGATHVVFAWRIGWPAEERAVDAGEPAGSAGAPILQVLRGAGLSDVCAAVAREFGGTKLGRGGLARAYGGAVRDALVGLPTRERRPRVRLRLVCGHARVGAVKRLLRAGEVELAGERYGAEAELELEVARERESEVAAALGELGVAWERMPARAERGP